MLQLNQMRHLQQAATATHDQAEAAAGYLRLGLEGLPTATPERQALILAGILRTATIHPGRSIDLELVLIPGMKSASPEVGTSAGSTDRRRWMVGRKGPAALLLHLAAASADRLAVHGGEYRRGRSHPAVGGGSP